MEYGKPEPKRDHKTKCEMPKDLKPLKQVVTDVCKRHENTRRLVRAYTNDYIMMRDSGQ